MDFDLPPDDDPRRHHIRRFLAEHPRPSRRELAAAGYIAPHWPPPWGLGADPEHQLIIEEELSRAGLKPLEASIGLGWAGPTILAGGTEEQQKRWLPGILDGTEAWAQLFSEPDAGSDLASLRTRAVPDGDVYRVTGQKIWSTWANESEWGILLARTDPDAPKHRGISYFVLDLRSPGIEIRPIVEMTGGNHFNEVFLTDVPIPVENRIGAEGEGWRLANVTLASERMSLSEGGVIWGMGPTSAHFFGDLRELGAVSDPRLRDRAVRVWQRAKLLELLGLRVASVAISGADAGPYASIRKYLADLHGQDITNLAKDLAGPAALVGRQAPETKYEDPWHWAFLFSRALTIGGGTSEVQKNIIAERLLGLPKEPAP